MENPRSKSYFLNSTWTNKVITMSTENIRSSNPKKRNLRIVRSILTVLILSLLAVIALKFYGDKLTSGTGGITKPKEVQLRYIPADYESNINEEDALAVLDNPQRYRREFNEMVFDINTSILKHVAKRMGLSESQRMAVLREYKDQYHNEFRNLYFRDFVRLRDTTSNLYETWYDNKSTSAVEVFNEIASKYTCFLTHQVMANVIKTEGGVALARGKKIESPCGIALTEALNPLIKKMEERAAIADFSRSKGLLQEKVERTIAELATYEIEDKKGISQQQSTKFLGFDVSTSDVEVSAISKIKAGFKIDDYFNIELNSRAEIVTITLPQPQVLSHEVYPKFDKLDIGWMREVQDQDFNKLINALRSEFRREALDEDRILEKAKTRATELMNTLFNPLITSFNPDFQLRVVFQQGDVNPEFEAPDLSSVSN